MATLSPLWTPAARKPVASAQTRPAALAGGRAPDQLPCAGPAGNDVPSRTRQSCRLQDVGRNKAAVFVERMREINPYATVELHDHGITAENVDDVTTRADIILD